VRLPRVYTPATAKITHRLPQLKEQYLEELEAGVHVHWVVSKTKVICRNGTTRCPFWKGDKA